MKNQKGMSIIELLLFPTGMMLVFIAVLMIRSICIDKIPVEETNIKTNSTQEVKKSPSVLKNDAFKHSN